MIAPGKSRNDRAMRGPSGYKDSGFSMDDGAGGGEDYSEEGQDKPNAVVPANCLSEGGDGGPQVGETISFDAEGVVKSVEGGNVVIALKTVNGEACDYGDSGDSYSGGQDNSGGQSGNTQESTDAMGARLRKRLQ